MTLPYQRSAAVMSVREFLLNLASPYGPTGIKRVPRAVRQEARALLKHYPSAWEMSNAADKMPELFSKKAAGEVPQPTPRPDWMGKPYWVDPPSGWRYGFPKLYDPAKDGPMREWMVANGYPKALADKGLACTFTAATEEAT
jgi:hypothetical protein